MTSELRQGNSSVAWEEVEIYRFRVLQTPGTPAEAATTLLSELAGELYDDLRLVPLLRRLMQMSCRVADAAGGSISIVEPGSGRYTKVAERGTACRLGQSFPLNEGVTGQVVTKRRPIVLSTYRDIVRGHLPTGHPAGDGAVAAIPIWWRGDVVAVNVIFAGEPRTFSTVEIDHLEALTQLAVPGFVTAAERELSVSYFATPHEASEADRPGGDGIPGSGIVAAVAGDLVALTDKAAVRTKPLLAWLHVAVGPGDAGLRLLVQDEPAGAASTVPASSQAGGAWQELVDRPGSAAGVEAIPVRETFVPTDLLQPDGRTDQPSPFSSRETQVAELLARGLSYRAVAEALVISPKTVEKHVGAVLRKTGTTSNTAAIVRALAAGWLDMDLLHDMDLLPDGRPLAN